MKILHIITRLDRGGSSDNTLLCCIGQCRLGHDVTLATGTGFNPDSPLKDSAGKVGVNLVFVPSLVRPISPLQDIKAVWDCRRLINEGRFDVVHTHTSKAGIVGRMAAQLAGGCRVVHTPHGHVFYGYFGRIKTKIFIWAERIMARWTDVIVTLTDREAEEHLEYGVGRPDQFVTVFSGIPIKNERSITHDKSNLRLTLGLPNEGPLVSTVGRLDPIKGHGTLIEGFAKVLDLHPSAHLVLAGDGESATEYKELVQKLGIRNHVFFLGWRDDIEALIKAADLFVLPSLNEGMGRTVLEAMSLGLPVVATNVGGIPMVVEDGITGLLVPPGDPDSIANAIGSILSNEAMRAAMGNAGRLKVSAFSEEAMVQNLETVYQRTLSSPPFFETSK